MITDQYAAGVFDGEGCITSSASFRPGKYEKFPRVHIQIGVSNNFLPLLDEFQGRYGGNIHKHARKCHLWRIVGKIPMRHFLLSVLPYLIVKREEAILALQFIETIREDNLGCAALSDEIHDQRKVIHLKLRKRKGQYSRKMKTFPEDSVQPRAGVA